MQNPITGGRMRDYRGVLQPGEEQRLSAAGKFVYARRLAGGPTPFVVLTVEQDAMRFYQGDTRIPAGPFSQFSLKNDSAAAITYDIVAGFGGYTHVDILGLINLANQAGVNPVPVFADPDPALPPFRTIIDPAQLPLDVTLDPASLPLGVVLDPASLPLGVEQADPAVPFEVREPLRSTAFFEVTANNDQGVALAVPAPANTRRVHLHVQNREAERVLIGGSLANVNADSNAIELLQGQSAVFDGATPAALAFRFPDNAGAAARRVVGFLTLEAA